MGITALQLREILEKLVELAKNYVFCEENDTVDEAEKERDALYAFNDTLLKCNIEIDINDLLCNIAEDGASFDLDDYFYYLFEELLESHFEPSKALMLQENFENEFAPEIEETLQRWNVYHMDGTPVKVVTSEYWYEKMEDLRNFFLERPEYAREYFYGSIY